MRALFSLLLTLSLVACGDDPPPPPIRDGGADSGGPADAGPADDAGDDAAADDAEPGVDSAPADAGTDAPPITDAGPFDANFPDMGPPDPVRICTPDTPRSRCRGCDRGYTCVDAFCTGSECVPGRPCIGNDDCTGGRCILPPGAEVGDLGVCEASLGTCDAHSDCPYGFQCESRDCIDRRIPCGFHPNGCPRGYTCTFAALEGALFCVPSNTPCEAGYQCEPGAVCADVDGDGSTECIPNGLCSVNADCPDGQSCGVDPGTSQAVCTVDGPCRDGACADGYTCLDTGVGRPRCVASGGTCSLDSECDPQAICGAINAADPLRCLTFDEEPL